MGLNSAVLLGCQEQHPGTDRAGGGALLADGKGEQDPGWL